VKYALLTITIIVLWAPAVACAHSGADYRTKHGFQVFLQGEEGPDKAELEAAIDEALANLVAHGIYTRAQIDRAVADYADLTQFRLRVNEGTMGFWCGESSPTGYCWGRFWSNYMVIEIVNQACIASTATVHEILHWAQWTIEGVIDIEHKDHRLFVSGCRDVPADMLIDCSKTTVERSTNWQLCLDRCGELCRE